MTPESKLAELGISLPSAPAPAAAYVPFVSSGNLILTAGQIAVADGKLIATGVVGREVDMQTAQRCAKQCAINVVAQLKAAVDDLTRVTRVLKLNVFVASTHDFTEQHLVANVASLFIAEVFGDAGLHARSAVGVPSLPLNSPVEIEAIVEFKD